MPSPAEMTCRADDCDRLSATHERVAELYAEFGITHKSSGETCSFPLRVINARSASGLNEFG